VLVCTLGDVLLDVIVRLDSRLAPGDDATARTTLAPGGQAANVAAWAAELGADARVVAVRAADDAGALVRGGLSARGIEVVGPEGERTGVVVSLVHPDGDRTMASDRASSPEFRAEDLRDEWLVCEALHLSGYSLMISPVADAAERAATIARAGGASVSVDLSSWTHIARFGISMRERLDRIRPEVVFGNEREWDEMGDIATGTCVVKRGAHGIVVNGKPHDAHPTEAVDATGAGDALAAGFIVGGPELALAAAARCVAQVGAMP
jgi:sugar/nucleoside kinase (ribokinase family)